MYGLMTLEQSWGSTRMFKGVEGFTLGHLRHMPVNTVPMHLINATAFDRRKGF